MAQTLSTLESFVIRRERPQLEQRLRHAGLNLALDEAGALPTQAVRRNERSGHGGRSPCGGYADNGLSRFHEKRLNQ